MRERTPTIVTAILLSAIWAATAGATDVAVVRPAHAGRMSEVEALGAPAIVNDLPPPDTSDVRAHVGPQDVVPGIMTPQGLASSTRAFGSFGIPYTTTRVQDGARGGAAKVNARNRLSTTFPYRAIGKLTSSDGYCSASLIRRGVIVTAAHCIQSFGSGGAIATGFQFRPGHYDGIGSKPGTRAPYGTWDWAALVRPGSWADGTDIGIGAARDNDIALIVLLPNVFGQLPGDLTGYLAYGWNNYSFITSLKTGNLHTAAVTTLGYPFLLDGGGVMQRTDGPTYTTTLGGAYQLWQGSNLTGGSSGGPWIVNFRTRAPMLDGGAGPGDASEMAVIAVTSWGEPDPNNRKDNWSSQFRQNTRYPDPSYGIYGAGNIGSLMNTLCSAAAPGGGTFASQGYCD